MAKLGDVLESSLRFGSKELGDLDPRLLRAQLLQNAEIISDHYQLTTESALAEEASVLRFARETRGDLPEIGSIEGDWLAEFKLSDEQHDAVKALSESRHGMSILLVMDRRGEDALARLPPRPRAQLSQTHHQS